MTDTTKPGDIHGHPIVECADDLHKTLAGHRHDDPSSDSGAEVWEDCWCPIQFVRPDPTPEPWAGHPIKCGWKLAVQDIQAALEACDE